MPIVVSTPNHNREAILLVSLRHDCVPSFYLYISGWKSWHNTPSTIMKLFWLLLFLVGTSLVQSEERPNFLFIISDDQAPDAICALGNDEIHTPNLDRLVEQGTSFVNCFNQGSWSGAVCVASRTMLITGKTVYEAPKVKSVLLPWAHAKKALAVEEDISVPLWPQVFREAGYDTFLTGKWHNTPESVLLGFSHGTAVGDGFYDTFDQNGSKAPGYNRPTSENNHWTPWDPQFTGHWTPEVWDITGEGIEGDRYQVEQHTSELYSDAAVEFLETAKESEAPFLMFVSYNAPHDPRQAPREFIEQYPPESLSLPANYLPEHPFDNGAIKIRDEKLGPMPRTEEVVKVHQSEYYAIMTHMDREIGRVLDALKASGKAENTYVIFTSDHGLAVGSHGLLGKQNPYDHSIKMPFIICGPDIPADRKVEEMIYMQSVYATTCELAGIAVPESVEFPSLRSLAMAEEGAEGESVIFGTYQEAQRLVRTRSHKLIYYPRLDRYQLFDLEKDPDEITDVIESPDYGEIRQKLMKTLRERRIDLGDGLLN